MTLRELIQRKRAYLRRYPAPKEPPEGYITNNAGGYISLEVIERYHQAEMSAYDRLPRWQRDVCKERLICLTILPRG